MNLHSEFLRSITGGSSGKAGAAGGEIITSSATATTSMN